RYIYPGYTADLTGLLAGDVITGAAINGKAVEPVGELPFSPTTLNDWLADQERPEITLQILRDGKTLTFPLKVRNMIRRLEEVPGASALAKEIRRSMFSL